MGTGNNTGGAGDDTVILGSFPENADDSPEILIALLDLSGNENGKIIILDIDEKGHYRSKSWDCA